MSHNVIPFNWLLAYEVLRLLPQIQAEDDIIFPSRFQDEEDRIQSERQEAEKILAYQEWEEDKIKEWEEQEKFFRIFELTNTYPI
jgi:hypothetical protein